MTLKAVAFLWCDPDLNGLGLPSRLRQPLAGVPLLLRVARRAAAIPGISKVVLAVPEASAAAFSALPLPDACEWMPTAAVDVPQRPWLRRARKWSLDGWRGGIGWTSHFDEEGPPAALLEACRRHGADALLKLPSHAPFLDPVLNGALLDLHLRRRGTYQFTFAQAPPGLMGEAYHPDFLAAMARHDLTPRHALRVQPGGDGMDPQRSECHLQVPERIRNALGRLTAESGRLWDLCEHLAGAGGDRLDAAGLLDLLDAHPAWRLGDAPREILIDLDERLSPGDLREGLEDLRASGDATVTLGVRGDPLAHGSWEAGVAACRDAGVYGIHLRTAVPDMDALLAARIMASAADVVTVSVDAGQGAEAVASAGRTLDALRAEQQRLGPAAPLLCGEYLMHAGSEGGLPAWWDAWQGKADWLALRPASGRPGFSQLPPRRIPCRKLTALLYVRADGGILPCAEGAPADPPLARLGPGALRAAWTGSVMETLRAAHRADRHPAASPPCGTCREWGWI